MSRIPCKHRPQTGFSLVELMIALTLGLLLIAAVGALFFANKRNYNQNTLIAEMQDNARFAMQALSRDLAMAGFLGGMMDTSLLQTTSSTIPTLGQDCGPGADGETGWAFDSDAIEILDDAAPASVNATYGCLAAADVEADTDILVVRRVSGQASADIETTGTVPNLAANTFYLRTNRTVGSLFFSQATASYPSSGHPPNSPPMTYWEYYSRLYYVRPYAETLGDGIPTLCRAYLVNQTSPAVDTECIAEGIQDMQIAFGIDSDGDGVANRYATDPSRAELEQAVTARIQLLMRSRTPDYGYDNDKTYNLTGKDDDGDGSVDETNDGYTPADHYYRRIIQTTVLLKNPSLAQAFNP